MPDKLLFSVVLVVIVGMIGLLFYMISITGTPERRCTKYCQEREGLDYGAVEYRGRGGSASECRCYKLEQIIRIDDLPKGE